MLIKNRAAKTEMEDRALAALQQSNAGMTVRDMASALSCTEGYAYRLLAHLVAHGRARSEQSTGKTFLYFSVGDGDTPYTGLLSSMLGFPPPGWLPDLRGGRLIDGGRGAWIGRCDK